MPKRKLTIEQACKLSEQEFFEYALEYAKEGWRKRKDENYYFTQVGILLEQAFRTLC